MPKVAISLAGASGSMLRDLAFSSLDWKDKAAGSGGQVPVLEVLVDVDALVQFHNQDRFGRFLRE